MIINNHRKHSSFAIKHFLAGSCSTPDGAYCLLYAQREQIKMDVAAGDAAVMKQKADVLEFELNLKKIEEQMDATAPNNTTSNEEHQRLYIEYLRTKAEYVRLKAALENFELNYEGAKRELEELNTALDQLKPQCKYWNEDILQMEQDMQNDEWAGELKNRVENMMLSSRLGIPYDHLATMRQHPDFYEKIVPHIAKTSIAVNAIARTGELLEPLKALGSDGDKVKSVLQLTSTPTYNQNLIEDNS
jgi:predicted  nucleic acid-binding Zn-ribbon protein